jgi:hypothetical protein
MRRLDVMSHLFLLQRVGIIQPIRTDLFYHVPRYLLTCECGRQAPVEIGQAGGQVKCACGATLSAPTLRQLRNLPIEQSRATTKAQWTAHQGAIAAGLVFACLLGAASVGLRLSEPKPVPFDRATRMQIVDQRLETLSPAESWDWWTAIYRPLAEYGFSEIQSPLSPAEQLEIRRKRRMEIGLLIAAGLSAAAAVGTAVWPANRTRRHGDLETSKIH